MERDAAAAEAEIRIALELSPHDPWIYVVLGDINRDEGRMVEAKELYEQALTIEPGFEAAQNRLNAIKPGD
jgi:Flp pilus assembly protein TadD